MALEGASELFLAARAWSREGAEKKITEKEAASFEEKEILLAINYVWRRLNLI